jgi:hypothetical protein
MTVIRMIFNMIEFSRTSFRRIEVIRITVIKMAFSMSAF